MRAQTAFEITQWIDAPLEVVFEYFTVAERMAQWQGVEARLDPRPGGLWWCRYENGAIARGEFIEVRAPEYLAYTWGLEKRGDERFFDWEHDRESLTPVGQSRVEVRLSRDGDGTRVDVRHTGFHPDEPVAQGWPHFLGQLEQRFARPNI